MGDICNPYVTPGVIGEPLANRNISCIKVFVFGLLATYPSFVCITGANGVPIKPLELNGADTCK
jgi:hypothetical protein